MKPSLGWLWPRLLPSLLVTGGIAGAIWIAAASQSSVPLTAKEAGLLAAFSAVLNISGAALFARVGRAAPAHARSAVRRLLGIGQALSAIDTALREGSEGGGAALRTATHVATAQVEMAAIELRAAIDDWNDIHHEALREVLETAREGQESQ